VWLVSFWFSLNKNSSPDNIFWVVNFVYNKNVYYLFVQLVDT